MNFVEMDHHHPVTHEKLFESTNYNIYIFIIHMHIISFLNIMVTCACGQ